MGEARRQVGTLFAAVAVTTAFVWLVARPLHAKLSATYREYTLVEVDRRQRGVQAQAVLELERETREMRVAMAMAAQRVPNRPQVGPLVERLAEVSAAADLRDENIIPQAPYIAERMGVLPIEMTFRSTFSSLFTFLQRIESLERTVRVSRIETTRVDGGVPLLETRLGLQVFFDPFDDA